METKQFVQSSVEVRVAEDDRNHILIWRGQAARRAPEQVATSTSRAILVPAMP